MRDIGILYTEENRLAVIEDRKTMTRRIPASFNEINDEPDGWILGGWDGGYRAFVFYSKKDIKALQILKVSYAVGDRLYIKESHYKFGYWHLTGLTSKGKPEWKFIYDKSKSVLFPDTRGTTRASHLKTDGYGLYRRSPLFMFKEDARHWQRVTGVKVERLQSITHDDICAEGWNPASSLPLSDRTAGEDSRDWYHALWDSINGPGVWERNPWTVAVSFERIPAEAKGEA
jgi:hypothetical protein